MYGIGDADINGQLPSGKGMSVPSQLTRVDPLRPACPNWIPICASVWVCTKPTIRPKACSCSSFQSPGHPGVIRASGDTHVISTMTSPAPPMARLPKCTRWKSPGTPFWHEYIAIGDTTIRFLRVTPRAVYGKSMGGRARSATSSDGCNDATDACGDVVPD